MALVAGNNNRALIDHPAGKFILRVANGIAADRRVEVRAEVIAFEHKDFTEPQKKLLTYIITTVPKLPNKSLKQFILAVFSPLLLQGDYVSPDGSSEAPIKEIVKTKELMSNLLVFLPFEDAINATLALGTPCYSEKLEEEAFEDRISSLTELIETICKNHLKNRKEYIEPHYPSQLILGRTDLDDFYSSPHLRKVTFLIDRLSNRLSNRFETDQKARAMPKKLKSLKALEDLECDAESAMLCTRVYVKKFTLNLQGLHRLHDRFLIGRERVEHLVIKRPEQTFSFNQQGLGLNLCETLKTLEIQDATLDFQGLWAHPQITTLRFIQCRNVYFQGLKAQMPNLTTVHIECTRDAEGTLKKYIPSTAPIKSLIQEGVKTSINHLSGEHYLLFMEENERKKTAHIQRVLDRAKSLPSDRYFIPWLESLQFRLTHNHPANSIMDALGEQISMGVSDFLNFSTIFNNNEEGRLASYFDPNTPPPTIPPPSLSSSSSSSSTSSSSSSLSSAAAPAAPPQGEAAAPPAGAPAAPVSRLASLLARLEQAQM